MNQLRERRMDLNNKTIVIFGGTGSIGTCLAEGFLKNSVSILVLVSNNEHELWLAKNKFKDWDYIHYVFCDIRDMGEIEKIFMKYIPEIVINCAALKHVNYCEEFPVNTIKTNILGLENLLHSASKWSSHFVQISTDKAVEPSGVMGASKLIGERLCMQWNNHTKVSVIRLGNVLGSRGSLVPQLENDIKKYGKAFITSEDMKRFVITKDEVWAFVKKVIENMEGGEIFIPKLEEINIIDLIITIARNHSEAIEVVVVGKGKAEKLREKMYSELEEVEDIGWALKIKS